MTFREIWRSGYVTRYHARPEVKAETLAEHHARTAQILCELYFPNLPSAELLFAALHHDVAELVVGDLPYPFKVAFPEIAKAHAQAEMVERYRILRRAFMLGLREIEELKLADRIAAYICGFPQDRENPEWGEEWGNIVKTGTSLGHDAAVSRILETVRPARPSMDALIREAEAAGLHDIAHNTTAAPRSAPENGLPASGLGGVAAKDQTAFWAQNNGGEA